MILNCPTFGQGYLKRMTSSIRMIVVFSDGFESYRQTRRGFLRPGSPAGAGLTKSRWFPQQPFMQAGFLTSGRGSPTNMLRFGILIALSVLASSVASAGSSPFRLRM